MGETTTITLTLDRALWERFVGSDRWRDVSVGDAVSTALAQSLESVAAAPDTSIPQEAAPAAPQLAQTPEGAPFAPDASATPT